jgi:hypothetical protein
MFLSKRSNGIYYLWLKDELGRKLKVSTRCKRKGEALKFPQSFRGRFHFSKTPENPLGFWSGLTLAKERNTFLSHTVRAPTPCRSRRAAERFRCIVLPDDPPSPISSK